MTLYFLSPLHISIMLVAAGLVGGLYALFRNASYATKRNVAVAVMSLNLIQHFFKHLIYPHLWGTPFGLGNTVYNLCAALIVFSPLFHFTKSETAKQFIAYAGTIAGSVAVIVPYWFFGKDIFAQDVLPEFIRFYLCHVLLIASSVLPALWGRVRFRFTDFWKFGFYFLGLLCVILLNDVIVLIATGEGMDGLYQKLLQLNPIAIMGPPADTSPFRFLVSIAEKLSPSVFLGGAGKLYTPILWYAFPVWLGITLLALLLGMIFDREHFLADRKPVGNRPLREMLPSRQRDRVKFAYFK